MAVGAVLEGGDTAAPACPSRALWDSPGGLCCSTAVGREALRARLTGSLQRAWQGGQRRLKRREGRLPEGGVGPGRAYRSASPCLHWEPHFPSRLCQWYGSHCCSNLKSLCLNVPLAPPPAGEGLLSLLTLFPSSHAASE